MQPITCIMRLSFFAPSNLIERHEKISSDPKEDLPAEKFYIGGTLCWIYQTWQLLQKENIRCDLVTEPPQEGIVILYMSDFDFKKYFPTSAAYSKNLFIVNVLGDGMPHAAAHLHLVQNRAHSRLLPQSLFIPHWPQPSLIPRDPQRSDRFENIFFLGNVRGIAPELISEEWNTQLRRALGLHFSVKEFPYWHDYSDVDAVVALRGFSRSSYLHKPASKLYNAWLAEVPFIGGRDSAYLTEGRPGYDYLIARSPRQVIKQLQHLKENKNLRSTLVKNGLQASAPFTQIAIFQHWKKMIQEILPMHAQRWQQKSNAQRHRNALWRQAFCAADQFFISRFRNPFILTD